MRFYVGLCNVHHARHFGRVMISANRLKTRRADFIVGEWMLDSGAFTTVKDNGGYPEPPEVYAAQIRRWSRTGRMVAAVSQDFMCEDLILARTGMTIPDHQRYTVARYDRIKELVGDSAYLMPVLQGYDPVEYLDCMDLYGDRLAEGQWVGVGSVCKRNSKVAEIEEVLLTIRRRRPDLRLHGFGVKTTALSSAVVRECLWSADSMAWSDAARKQALPLLLQLREEFGRSDMGPAEARKIWASRGVKMRDANDWREAERFIAQIDSQDVDYSNFHLTYS